MEEELDHEHLKQDLHVAVVSKSDKKVFVQM